jgi:hypothetical protein
MHVPLSWVGDRANTKSEQPHQTGAEEGNRGSR